MGIGTSIFLFAVGAILAFAVNVTSSDFNIHTIGIILMFVGGIGALLSLAFWSTWGGFNGGGRRTTVVDGGGARRTRVVEEEVV
jgi:hypothetical protein